MRDAERIEMTSFDEFKYSSRSSINRKIRLLHSTWMKLSVAVTMTHPGIDTISPWISGQLTLGSPFRRNTSIACCSSFASDDTQFGLLGQPLSPEGSIPISSGRFPEQPPTINRISANIKPISTSLHIYTNAFSLENSPDSMPHRSLEILKILIVSPCRKRHSFCQKRRSMTFNSKTIIIFP